MNHRAHPERRRIDNHPLDTCRELQHVTVSTGHFAPRRSIEPEELRLPFEDPQNPDDRLSVALDRTEPQAAQERLELVGEQRALFVDIGCRDHRGTVVTISWTACRLTGGSRAAPMVA